MASALIVASARAQDVPKEQSIWSQDTLTGDWGGARTALKNKGIDISINYIGETLAVLSGGLHERPSYEGRLEFSIDTDLHKLIGWDGASTHLTVYQIHNIGHVDAEDNVGSISDPSNIDAWATTRLFTAWYQQNWADDRISLRIGQLAADDEFMVSPTAAAGLINATFGWPSGFTANLPSGGPAYPLAAPGARLKLKPSDDISVLAAVFSGDPAGADCTDPNRQKCDRWGTRFSFSGGALAIGELQYTVNQGKEATGLPGVYKIGAWYHTADFADKRFGLTATGAEVSLADPSVVGPLLHRGDFAIYGVADQMVWRQGKASANVFLRGAGLPDDRNLLSFYLDGGVGITGLVPQRPKDVLTLGVVYSGFSPDVAALDADFLAIDGLAHAIRDHEVVFEASYAAQIAPWWTVQPDVQYFLHPNGGQNPKDPTLTLDHAFVAGIRSTIKF